MANQTALGFTIFARERASKALKQVGNDLTRLQSQMNSVRTVAGKGVGLAALAGGATALAAAVVPAAAAVVALPAAMVAAKVATGVLKVGLIGVGDAMSAVAEGDAAKLDQALEKLSPNARRFVTEMSGLKKEFDGVQRAVQDKLFDGLAAEMSPVARTLLPDVRTGMLGVASGLNSAAKEAVRFGASPMAKGAVNKTFASTGRIMGMLAGATRPALQVITQLTVKSLPLAERMAAWATNGVKAAGAFLSSERGASALERTVDRAGDTMGQLARIGGNTLKGLLGMFSQAKGAGDGLLDTLEKGTARFAAWSRSVEGQQQAADAFTLLKDTAVAVAGVLPLVLGPLGAVVKLVNGLPEPLRDGVVQFLALAVVVGAVTSKLGPLLSVVSNVGGAFTRADGPVQRFRDRISGIESPAGKMRGVLGGLVGLLGGPWGLALGAGAVALGLFASRNDEAERRVGELTDALVKNQGVLDESAIANVKNRLETEGVYRAAEKLGINLSRVTEAALGNKDALGEVNGQLKAAATNVVVYGGRAGQGQIAQRQLTGDAKLLNDAISGQNTELKEAAERYKRLVEASPSVASGSQGVAGGMDGVATAAGKASGKVSTLNTSLAKFNSLNGNADLAAIAFRDSLDDVSEAFGKNNSAIDKNTGKINIGKEAGRNANRVLISSIEAAVEHASKVRAQTGSVDKANAVFKTEVNRLRGVLTESGLSKKAIDRLVARYLKLPAEINGATGKINNRRVLIEVKAAGKLVGFRTNMPGGSVINASGGVMPDVLPGYSPGKDNHFFYSPDGRGKIGLSGGEAVMRPEWTKAVGSGYVHTMNSIARRGGAGAVAKAMGVGPRWSPKMGGEGVGYASGGIIAKHSFSGMSSVKKTTARAHKLYGSWASQMGEAVSKQYNKQWVGGPGVQNALKWARAQEGKPYIWGGVGPRGYDCSGFMSAITNVIKGRSPYSRLFTTHSFGSTSGPGGFVRNRQSGFRVGVTDAGVGHMAGTLGGVGVESRGSRGVVVGSAARGANNGLFSRRYGLKLANGGLVPWSFDNGGMLPTGTSLVHNGTGAPEPLANVDKMRGGDLIIREAHFHGVQDIAGLIKQIQKYARDNGGITLKVR